MDLVQQIADLKAQLDAANARIAKLESAPAATAPATDVDVAKHVRLCDFIFGTYFGNEVIKFNDKEAADAAKETATVAG